MNKKWLIAVPIIGYIIYKASNNFEPIDISEQLTRHSWKTYNDRDLNNVDTIVLHHSATLSSLPGSTPQTVANFHVGQYDWPGAGYHLMVVGDKVYLVNPLEKESYHTGTLNPTSIGIMIMGNFDQEPFPKATEEAVIKAVNWVQKKLGRKLKLHGHYQYSSKTCPGMNVRNKMPEIRNRTKSLT